jgi:hypothetical protein
MVWRVGAGGRIEAVPVRVTSLGDTTVQVAGGLRPATASWRWARSCSTPRRRCG